MRADVDALPLPRRRGLSPALRGLAMGAAGLLMVAGLAAWAGARVNGTRSIPLGLYWARADPLAKRAYVSFCPPPTELFLEAKRRGYLTGGPCPGGFGRLMKRVVGEGGDTVEISPEGIAVNGVLRPFSAGRPADAQGRPLPRITAARYTLAPGELLLMSDVSATSFDSRYFGPISAEHVQDVVVPVWTW